MPNRVLLPLLRGTHDGADCEICPFSTNGLPTNPVYSEFPEDPKWLIIGEGPGFHEIRQKRPFVGNSGDVVNKMLAKIGRPRDQVFVGNCTLCKPPEGSPESERQLAATACKPRLLTELARFPGKPILTLGAVAARSVIPKESLDAIEPPDAPKAIRRSQKLRQQPKLKDAIRRRKAVTKETEKQLKRLLNHERKRVITEIKVRHKQRPPESYIRSELSRVQGKLTLKAREVAIKLVDAKIKERAIAKQVAATRPKKPKKHKAVKITDICGTLFDVDVDGTGIRPVIPGIHPAALLRGGGASIGGSHTPDMAYVNLYFDAGKVDALAAGKDIRLKLDVVYELEDATRAFEAFMRVYCSALVEDACSIDLETYVDNDERHHALMAYVAKIRVIGIATKEMSVSLNWDLLPPICQSLLQLLLIQIECTYHNGLYDRTVLRAYGFIMGQKWFDCYVDSETEFLTERGWLKYADVATSDRLGTIDDEGRLEWQEHFQRVSKPYQGLALVFETQRTRAVVTPNHRMWVRPVRRTRHAWRGTPLGNWRFLRAEQMLSWNTDSFEVFQTTRPIDSDTPAPYADQYLKLLGLWLADGSLDWYRGKPRSIRISQIKGGKASKLLRELARTFDLRMSINVHREPWRSKPCIEEVWLLHDSTIATHFATFGAKSRQRKLPFDVFAWPLQARETLLEALFLGDGSEHGGRRSRFIYRSGSESLADSVQALALSLGWSATNPKTYRPDDICHVFISRKVDPVVQIRARTRGANASVCEIEVDDRIVCFSVPNETLVTRSRGKPAFYGNTLLAHHAAFPGNSHRLQHVVGQFVAVQPWKCLRGDVEVLLPDRSTIKISEAVQRQIPAVLSLEDGEIRTKRVTGWHKVNVPDQAWLRIKTERCDKKYNRGLIVTPDHKVMTERGLVEAQDLRPNEDRIAVDEPLFSADQVAVALGTLLGDSSVFVSRVFHKDPWKAKRASIRGGHANRALRDMKSEALALGTVGNCAPAHTRTVRSGASIGTTINAADFFHYGTKWAFQYMQLASFVYDAQWKRRIKPEVLSKLGRRGLAMMFMDDGDLRNSKSINAGFATNGFPLEDVELFAQWLRELYGPVAIYTQRGPYCSLSVKATRNMLEDLRGYIHPAVGYKTIFDDPFIPVANGQGVYHALISSVEAVDRSVGPRWLMDHRFCLSVEDTKLFFTNYGLVSNSEFRNAEETPEKLAIYNAKDTGGTHAVRIPLQLWMQRTKTKQVFDLDLQMSDAASAMHLAGMPVDREINSELLTTFTKTVIESRRHVEDIANDPKRREEIWHHLAIQQAGKKRKLDPDDFEERYQVRLSSMKLDPDWKWKIGAGKHIAALLLAMGVGLYQTTAGGDVSTKKEVLESLTEVAVVRDIIDYREADKLLSTFVVPIFDRHDQFGNVATYGFADEYDRIHPIWNVHRITGRWASAWPVVSNVPKDRWKKLVGDVLYAIRTLIENGLVVKGPTSLPDGRVIRVNKDDSISQMTRPNLRRQIRVNRPGRMLVGFDFGQIEARVIALISGDPFLCAIFAEDRDPHIECARLIWTGFDALDPDTRKQLRENVKNIEYGYLYMAQLETLHKTMLKAGNMIKLVDLAIAISRLEKAMPAIKGWHQSTIAGAMMPPHEIKDFLLGRRRCWPMGNVEGPEAVNYGVQTAAAALMNMGMANMMPKLAKYQQAWPIAQIHDAAVFECWADDTEALAKDCKESFERRIDRDGRSIPFPIDVKIGESWDRV